MNRTESSILPHHEGAARMWGRGGRAYDDVSFAISDALAHAAQRLHAGPGEEILDVATGTGWSARNVARSGARVTAVDISPELLAAAAELSSHVRPAIAFQQADAERLPFPDRRFDGIISTFGVMFAANQKQAAAELARVCRPGGRVSIATWAPDGSVAEFFSVVGRHSDAPPRLAARVGRRGPRQGAARRRLRPPVRGRREPRVPSEHRADLGVLRDRLRADQAGGGAPHRGPAPRLPGGRRRVSPSLPDAGRPARQAGVPSHPG